MSMGPVWTVVAVLVLLVLAWYLSFTAGRLDRLHARVESTRDALDAQLVRRAALAQELATSGLLDPASSMLVAGAASEALNDNDTQQPAQREAEESALSRCLREALEPDDVVSEVAAVPSGHQLLVELGAACRRVEMARRFHNDAVTATRAVRRKRVVRWLRLAGHAPLPATFEMDDEAPAGLPR
ncbi:MAG: hypothetical protein ACTHMW_16010 [Actinomycetes bacterium]